MCVRRSCQRRNLRFASVPHPMPPIPGVDLIKISLSWNHNTAAGMPACLITSMFLPPAVQSGAHYASDHRDPPIGAGAMTVNWTRGDGTFVIVIGRQGAVTSTPTDGALFRQFHRSERSWPRTSMYLYGSGTSVNVTDQCNPLRIALYSNSTAPVVPTNYLLTTPATGTQSTASCVLAVEPTVGASGEYLAPAFHPCS